MKNKKGISGSIGLLLAGVVCFFIVHRSDTIAPGAVNTFISYLVTPFLVMQSSVIDPVHATLDEWKKITIVQDEYKKVCEQRDDLQAQLIELELFKTVFDETAEMREFAQQYERPPVALARVILKQFTPDAHFFLLDRGAFHGVCKDTAVVHKNCLIGKVSEVYPHYCRVTLITDQNCKVASYCHATKTQGIYEGCCSQSDGKLSHVDHLSTLEMGDRILSSGEGLIFPSGFAIGTITDFSKNAGEMHYSVQVAPLFDLSTLSYCAILPKKIDEQVSGQDVERQTKMYNRKQVEELLG